MMAKLGTYFKL